MRLPLSVSVAAVLFAAACQEQRIAPPAPSPVRLEVLRRAEFAPSLTLVGTLRAAQTIPLTATQRGTLVLAPRFAHGLRTGESVRAGETIAEVRNDAVAFSRTQARLQLEAALVDHERMERSHRDGVVSGREYSASALRAKLARETYASTQREVGALRIAAPAAGTLVVQQAFASGATVDAGTVLAEVATSGAPLVEASVAASDRALLRRGLVVRFEGPGGWTGSGTIEEVATVLDSAGTARVVARLDAGAVTPAPGTGVDLRVELDRRPDVLTVPDDAIVVGEQGAAVFVVAMSDGLERAFRVKRAGIETGGRANGRVEVKSGIRDGDRVVVSGADALTDDALVIEAPAQESRR